MNEEDLKRLVRQSELRTNDDFTDRLMEKIDASRKTSTQPQIWSFRYVSVSVIILSVLAMISGLSLLDLSALGSKLLLFVPSAFVFLLAINHFLLLKRWSNEYPEIQQL